MGENTHSEELRTTTPTSKKPEVVTKVSLFQRLINWFTGLFS